MRVTNLTIETLNFQKFFVYTLSKCIFSFIVAFIFNVHNFTFSFCSATDAHDFWRRSGHPSQVRASFVRIYPRFDWSLFVRARDGEQSPFHRWASFTIGECRGPAPAPSIFRICWLSSLVLCERRSVGLYIQPKRKAAVLVTALRLIVSECLSFLRVAIWRSILVSECR